ncbi:MAG TPA: class F sortase [Frankiaceae bacterium]|nr:class F sortase [Frankiaceae bacterium]
MNRQHRRPSPRWTLSRVLAGAGALLVAVAIATAGYVAFTSSAGPQVAAASTVQPLAVGAPPFRGGMSMAKSVPVRVQIPAIGVDSGLMGLGRRPDGTMQVPPTGFPAGGYTLAPTPGELGPAVVAGHVDWDGAPGVFSNLHKVKAGDIVGITRADRTTAIFRVSRVQEFPKAEFPTSSVYGNLDYAGLRLITCGGSFDRQAHSYRDNIVAYAELVATGTPGKA